MKRMNSAVLAMLEKTHFFDFSGYSAFDSAVKVEIEPLRGFQFFLPYRIFLNLKNPEERERESFSYILNSFVRQYILAWAKYIGKKDDSLDVVDFAIKFADTCQHISKKTDEIFEKIKSGSQSAQIELSVNNTKMELRRFGDLLAVGNIVNSTTDKEHKTGVRVLKSLCRAEDPSNNHGIYELIQGVKCTIPLGCLCPSGKFDNSTLSIIRNCLGYAPENVLRVEDVVSVYRKRIKNGIVLGQFHGLNVVINFIYPEAENSQDIKHTGYNNFQEACRFRGANIAETDDGSYIFHSWDDLSVVLTLSSSLRPYRNLEAETLEEQFRLNYAGCIFSSRLCSMIMNNWLEHRKEMEG